MSTNHLYNSKDEKVESEEAKNGTSSFPSNPRCTTASTAFSPPAPTKHDLAANNASPTTVFAVGQEGGAFHPYNKASNSFVPHVIAFNNDNESSPLLINGGSISNGGTRPTTSPHSSRPDNSEANPPNLEGEGCQQENVGGGARPPPSSSPTNDDVDLFVEAPRNRNETDQTCLCGVFTHNECIKVTCVLGLAAVLNVKDISRGFADASVICLLMAHNTSMQQALADIPRQVRYGVKKLEWRMKQLRQDLKEDDRDIGRRIDGVGRRIDGVGRRIDGLERSTNKLDISMQRGFNEVGNQVRDMQQELNGMGNNIDNMIISNQQLFANFQALMQNQMSMTQRLQENVRDLSNAAHVAVVPNDDGRGDGAGNL